MYLETKRLIIRDWRLSDINDMYEYAKDERVGPMAGWPIHKSREDSKKVIENMIVHQEAFAVELKEEKKVIGGVGIHDRVILNQAVSGKQRELGYVLNPRYWGNGYIPEAINALIDYSFKTLDLDRLWITCYNNNHNSIRVIEKCGFKKVYGYWKETPLLDHPKTMCAYYKLEKTDYEKEDL